MIDFIWYLVLFQASAKSLFAADEDTTESLANLLSVKSGVDKKALGMYDLLLFKFTVISVCAFDIIVW